jgi:hypothetical protein
MNSIIQNLKNTGELRIYLDFRSGTINDFSVYNNIGSFSGTTRIYNRVGLLNISSGYLTYPHSEALVITSGITMVVRHLMTRYIIGGNSYIIKTGTTPIYSLSANLTNVSCSNGITSSIFNRTTFYGYETVGASYNSGTKPQFYRNGVYIGEGNNALTIGGGSTTLNFLPHSGYSCYYSCALVISRVLTATEHSQLYYELESIKWPNNL